VIARVVVIAVSLFALAAAGCEPARAPASATPTATPPTTTTAAATTKRTAHLHKPELPGAPSSTPQRIVSLAPVVTETLFAVGAGEHIVGVTRYCDTPTEAQTRTVVGGYADPNLELILGLKPDLVIAMPSFAQRPVLDRLRDDGVPVLVVFGDTLDEVKDLIGAIGRFTGADAATTLRALDDDLRAAAATAGARSVPAVVVVGTEPLVVAGPGSFADSALATAGGRSVVPVDAPAWPQWSLEILAERRPRVVVAAEGPAAAARLREFLARAHLEAAVVSGEGPLFMRPGPRLGRDVRALAALLAPFDASTAIEATNPSAP
jgi:iron complex transport system substrate-binding protein